MRSALVIGGTRFIGRHTVSEFLEQGYRVTLFNRGNHEDPFADHERSESYTGDRTDESAVADAADAVDPDIVVDCAAYKPAEVETAVDVFADVEAYVYVSSVGVYDDEHVSKHEDETPLVPCSPEEAVDDSFETYGARKAEGDRVVYDAAERGVEAMSVRPSMVYGPYDYTGNFDYWVDRVLHNDRVVVPGDGTYVCHRTYVEDVASAIRTVAERGDRGEAYNVGDRRPLTMDQSVELIAKVSDREVQIVHADERDLAREGLSRADFPLYIHDVPFVLSTDKLANLGWESTAVDEAMERTVGDYRQSDRTEREMWPAPESEQRVIDERS